MAAPHAFDVFAASSLFYLLFIWPLLFGHGGNVRPSGLTALYLVLCPLVPLALAASFLQHGGAGPAVRLGTTVACLGPAVWGVHSLTSRLGRNGAPVYALCAVASCALGPALSFLADEIAGRPLETAASISPFGWDVAAGEPGATALALVAGGGLLLGLAGSFRAPGVRVPAAAGALLLMALCSRPASAAVKVEALTGDLMRRGVPYPVRVTVGGRDRGLEGDLLLRTSSGGRHAARLSVPPFGIATHTFHLLLENVDDRIAVQVPGSGVVRLGPRREVRAAEGLVGVYGLAGASIPHVDGGGDAAAHMVRLAWFPTSDAGWEAIDMLILGTRPIGSRRGLERMAMWMRWRGRVVVIGSLREFINTPLPRLLFRPTSEASPFRDWWFSHRDQLPGALARQLHRYGIGRTDLVRLGDRVVGVRRRTGGGGFVYLFDDLFSSPLTPAGRRLWSDQLAWLWRRSPILRPLDPTRGGEDLWSAVKGPGRQAARIRRFWGIYLLAWVLLLAPLCVLLRALAGMPAPSGPSGATIALCLASVGLPVCGAVWWLDAAARPGPLVRALIEVREGAGGLSPLCASQLELVRFRARTDLTLPGGPLRPLQVEGERRLPILHLPGEEGARLGPVEAGRTCVLVRRRLVDGASPKAGRRGASLVVSNPGLLRLRVYLLRDGRTHAAGFLAPGGSLDVDPEGLEPARLPPPFPARFDRFLVRWTGREERITLLAVEEGTPASSGESPVATLPALFLLDVPPK